MARSTTKIAQLAALGPTLCLALITANAEVFPPVVEGSVGDVGPMVGAPRDGVPDFVSEFFSIVLNPLQESRGILEFDLRSIDPANVQAAVLTVVPVGVSFDVSVIPVQLFGFSGDGELQLNDFDVGTILASFDFPTTSPRPINVPIQFDVSGFIQSEMNFVGFNFRIDPAIPGNAGITFGTSDLGSPASSSITGGVVEAGTRIDASTFVNDPDFCGDGDHMIPDGERLKIVGGSGSSFSLSCNLELGEGATFVIKRAILDIDTFAINSGGINNNATVEIIDSSIFTGDELNFDLVGDHHTVICIRSFLAQMTGDDFGIEVSRSGGNGGKVILDECTLATTDGGVDISASSMGTGGKIRIEESKIIAADGISMSVGGSERIMRIKDSMFMSGMDIEINSTGAKVRSGDNVYYAGNGVVVTAATVSPQTTLS